MADARGGNPTAAARAATSGGRSATPGPLLPLCRDALAKKCQGMLAIHWRTRDVEEAAALEAQFAWNPQLTYEQFFDGFARRCYGPAWAAEMGAVHRELEALGPATPAPWARRNAMDTSGFSWFDDGRLPKPENLAKLAALRARIARVRAARCSKQARRRAWRESTGC